jgi:processive 1,2-diacylglycerol beta-glucosyltransferase
VEDYSWGKFYKFFFRREKGLKRILILTVLAGMGHVKAAEAIGKGIKEVNPDVEVKVCDPIGITLPKLQRFFNYSYLFLANYIPPLWGWIYDSKILYFKYNPIRLYLARLYAKSIKTIIDEFMPNLVVSAHPFIANGIAELKKKKFINIPLVSVATDYHVHPLGINKYVDLFIIPSKEVAIYLKGIKDDKIKVSGGLPIEPKFFKALDKNQLIKKFGIQKDKKVVLILCGGFGMGKVGRLLKGFGGIDFSLQLLVVAGKNEKLKGKLSQIANQLKINTKIFGFVDNIEELMSVSDIVVTKPSGIAMSEALVKGLPLILTKAVPGQERYNVDILLKEGIAIQPKNLTQIPTLIINLFSHKNKLQQMQQRIIQRFADVKAVYNIGNILSSSIKNGYNSSNSKTY